MVTVITGADAHGYGVLFESGDKLNGTEVAFSVLPSPKFVFLLIFLFLFQHSLVDLCALLVTLQKFTILVPRSTSRFI